MTTTGTAPTAPSRGLHRALWVLQAVLAAFFVVASAAPKLAGEAYAVQTFEDMGAPTWLRYVVGLAELAGGVGLLVPRLAGLAAVGLALLMVGAAVTQAFILHGGVLVVTPVVLFVLFVVVAWGRRESVGRLVGR